MKPIKKTIVIFVLSLIFAIKVYSQELTVAVASNFQFAMVEIQNEFEQNTNIKINTVFGSSGKLTVQIQNGAPFDLFLSADMKYPEILFSQKKTYSIPEVYAYGSLVLWTKKPIDLTAGISVLLDKKIKKIAIANPVTAPYGRESLHVLQQYQMLEEVKAKLVYARSIAQVNQYVYTKVVDIGFTAKSVVMSQRLLNQGTWAEIDQTKYTLIKQGVVLLKYGRENHPRESKQFYDFLFSDQTKRIIKNFGYRLP